MSLFDAFVIYLYGLKYLLFLTMIILAICSLDDLFIDLYYWIRRGYRRIVVYRRHTRSQAKDLFKKEEKPLAIMVPAWQEHGVIGKMAELAASQLDYENYQIFIGTYPNDPDTQKDVDDVCLTYPNVHKVVCARPGPTSKADCLNNIIYSIVEFEKKAKVEFSGFILHDSEDVISSLELRLFNYLLPEKDFIQLPVYPYVKKWYQFTRNHYADEFAELHGKDVIVREALSGQVPSAGVGTCFSRKAILKLMISGDGIAFDTRSLTEDYDIGFRLKQWGMSEIFVRFSVIDEEFYTLREDAFGVSAREGNVVCVREFFPANFSAAVRQKSRWIVGIVFQGFYTHKWTDDWKINYFLWRDRRGFINNAIGFIAMLLLIQLVAIYIYTHFFPDAYHFVALIKDDPVTHFLLMINFVFFINRMGQRFYFVSQYYGVVQGGLSLGRVFWGTVINFFANIRAIRQVLKVSHVSKVRWDKTTHDFPSVNADIRRKPIGQILVENGELSEAQLNEAILNKPKARFLGAHLVCSKLVSNQALSKAVALQANAPYRDCEPFTLDPDLIAALPKEIAVKYSVLPIAEEGGVLILGKETPLSPVALSSIKRRLKRPVTWCITRNGGVTLGIRHWYFNDSSADPTKHLEWLSDTGKFSHEDIQAIESKYYATQSQLGTCLVLAGLIEPAVLNQAILAFEKVKDSSLGRFLVHHDYLSQEYLEQGIELQKGQQKNILELAALH